MAACWAFVMAAGPAGGQTLTAGITGTVRDESQAVLPGVTIEAASPSLIEKVRSTVSDGEGRYNFVDLVPGTYSVTFTLPGFRTFVRDGVTINAGFTATVNGDMSVGGIEESITVSGAAPVVDTQNVRRQTTASRDILDGLPVSTKRVDTLVTLTPGFQGIADVGGRYNSEPGAYHGKRGTKQFFDGMGIENSAGNSSYQVNAAVVEEMVLNTSGMSAEINADGPVMNIVPKEGGNQFKFIASGLYTNDKLETNTLSDELRSKGINETNRTNKIFDNALTVGGPIKKDKMWFFGGFRTWGMARQFAGLYWNRGQQTLLSPPGADLEVVKYDPWIDRPFDSRSGRWEWYDSYLGRVTYQPNPKNKFNFLIDHQIACNCGGQASNFLQEGTTGYRFEPNLFMQLTYNSPITSKLLLEVGVGASLSQWNAYWNTGTQAGTVSIVDVALGKTYGSSQFLRAHPNWTNRQTQRAALTYVTGAHTFKTGFIREHMYTDNYIMINGNVVYTFRNGTPISISQRTTPYLELDRTDEIGIFAQDQWRINKLTLNYGVRFDYVNGYVPRQDIPGTPDEKLFDRFPGVPLVNPWVGTRTFDAVDGIPNWKDVNPRFGASYDLFGNGRTALKFALGRYVAKTNVDVAVLLNPITTGVNAASRAWSDANANYYPDCDLGNFTANGECGAISDQNFGRQNPRALQWADEVRTDNRDFNWDMNAELQHELTRGLSINGGYYFNNGGYYRNVDSMQRVTDNELVGPNDFDEFCVTAPVDTRLPNGGGYEICGLSAIKPSAFGLSRPVVKATSNFGQDVRRNHFFGFGVNARLPRGIRLGGGFDAGYISRDQCFDVDSRGLTTFSVQGTVIPGAYGGQTATMVNGQQVCKATFPVRGLAMLKLNGSVPIKGGFSASAIWQDQAGPPVDAVWAVPNATIAPRLGRNLAGNTAFQNVPLVRAGELFEDRIRRLDLRLSKSIALPRRLNLQLNFDAYNALNSSASQSINTVYGANWRQPLLVLDPRILQISGMLTF
ncbi:MAG: carboxypeptidase regulatory-like domain-containing protein [Vicinamibacterales bacterium]